MKNIHFFHVPNFSHDLYFIFRKWKRRVVLKKVQKYVDFKLKEVISQFTAAGKLKLNSDNCCHIYRFFHAPSNTFYLEAAKI